MNTDTKDMPVFDLEVQYDSEFNQVVITMNETALASLSVALEDLKRRGKPGSHYQYDDPTGLSGNVDVLVIAKR